MQLFPILRPLSFLVLFLHWAGLSAIGVRGDTTTGPTAEHPLIEIVKHTTAMCQAARSEIADYKAAKEFKDDSTQSAGILNILIKHIDLTSTNLAKVQLITLTLTPAESQEVTVLSGTLLDCFYQGLDEIQVVYSLVPGVGVFIGAIVRSFSLLRAGGNLVVPLARRFLR